MEKSTDLLASAKEDELFVADILLNLPQIIAISESKSQLSWGSKKRRSGLNAALLNYHAPALPPPSLSIQITENEIEQTRPQIKSEEDCGAAAATDSPNTPLFFSFTESDENNNNFIKKKGFNFLQRERDMEKKIEELTGIRDVLKREIENVRKYYNKLMAENSGLKSTQQEVLKTLAEKESQQMEELTQINKVIKTGYALTMRRACLCPKIN